MAVLSDFYLLSIRILTRVLPFLLEDSTDPIYRDVIWNISNKEKSTKLSSLIVKFRSKRFSWLQFDLRSIGFAIPSRVWCSSIFAKHKPQFHCVAFDTRMVSSAKSDTLTVYRAGGCGIKSVSGSSEGWGLVSYEIISNRTEVLKCLISICSSTLYCPPGKKCTTCFIHIKILLNQTMRWTTYVHHRLCRMCLFSSILLLIPFVLGIQWAGECR